jgi:hypothetical protein
MVGTDNEIAAACGVARRTVQRWRAGERLSFEAADRHAIRAGHHPAYLWPEYFGPDSA